MSAEPAKLKQCSITIDGKTVIVQASKWDWGYESFEEKGREIGTVTVRFVGVEIRPDFKQLMHELHEDPLEPPL